jgi:hypothetical protein
MMQNKLTSTDNTSSVFNYVDENLSEAESNNCNNEIGDNQISEHKGGTSKQ